MLLPASRLETVSAVITENHSRPLKHAGQTTVNKIDRKAEDKVSLQVGKKIMRFRSFFEFLRSLFSSSFYLLQSPDA